MGFVELSSTDANSGQRNDGCSTMSSVQKCIKTIYPAARYYVHWRSHQLQLVIVNSCKNVPQIRDAMAILVKISWFLSGCAKGKNIVKSLLKENNKDLTLT